MTAPRSDLLELNRLRHHVLTWEAPPGAPTLVMLHGYLDLAWSFAPFVDELQQRLHARIIAPDLRGHGETEWVGRGGYYHFPDYVADVVALLRTLPTPVLLLGHSMGGTIASIVAGSFPELIQKLVLIEGLGPLPSSESAPERMGRWIHDVEERSRKPSKPMPSREAAAARLRETNERLTEALSLFLVEHGTRPVEGGYVWAYDPLHRTRSPASFSLEIYRSFLRQIACPTLLVEASESLFPLMLAEDDRAGDIAQLQRARLEQAGHMIHHDQPAALAAAVAAFLNG